MSRQNDQNDFVVEFTLPLLARRIAHGMGHMPPIDLTTRLLTLVAAAGITAWTLTAGHVLLPLAGAGSFALQSAITAVELYAAGAFCEQVTKERGRGR